MIFILLKRLYTCTPQACIGYWGKTARLKWLATSYEATGGLREVVAVEVNHGEGGVTILITFAGQTWLEIAKNREKPIDKRGCLRPAVGHKLG